MRFLGEWRPVTVAAYPTTIIEQDHRFIKRKTRGKVLSPAEQFYALVA